MGGPLTSIRVVELAGLGPAPFCGMVLADLGAEVIRVDRPDGAAGEEVVIDERFDLHGRGKSSVAIDLKHADGPGLVLRLATQSDILIEGYRPGVAERLGVGPERCLQANPALVYGRMTGWGQTGPLSARAGHDIDYVGVSGALHPIGIAEAPTPPLNLVGDYGGGGMLLAVGVLAALTHARNTGSGQVVDASMVDGSALLTTAIHGLLASDMWLDQRQSNLLDGGAPFYTTYRTADGRHVAVGALEPAFYARLLDGLGLDPSALPSRESPANWPSLREVIQEVFLTRTRDQWADLFAGDDACVAPVLSLSEAPMHPHNVQRMTFVEIDGVIQPAPAPRFSATPTALPTRPVARGRDTDRILRDLGLSDDDIGKLRRVGAVT
ncbi:MAG: CaiB/BaiF CoA-transferase family protein [Acidimicrobiia bacterium]